MVPSRLLDRLEATRPDGKSEGYAPDPKLGAFVGWPVTQVTKAAPYNPEMFPGQNVLVAVDEADRWWGT